MYIFVYQFWTFKFNCNSILWWVETEFSVNLKLVAIVSVLVRPLIPLRRWPTGFSTFFDVNGGFSNINPLSNLNNCMYIAES